MPDEDNVDEQKDTDDDDEQEDNDDEEQEDNDDDRVDRMEETLQELIRQGQAALTATY